MTVTASAKLREIAVASGSDPRQALFDAVGDISGFEVFHNLVLVVTYIGPEKTKGGIFLADRTLAEARFQSNVGLVLAVGPRAFQNDVVTNFGGVSVERGDWVMYRASDGREVFIVDASGRNGTPCRLLEDVHIKARVSDPDLVY